MSLLAILFIGAAIGALFNLFLRGRWHQPRALAAAVGAVGAFVTGGMANEDTLIVGLRWESLVAGGLGALALVLIVAFIRHLPEAPSRRRA